MTVHNGLHVWAALVDSPVNCLTRHVMEITFALVLVLIDETQILRCHAAKVLVAGRNQVGGGSRGASTYVIPHLHAFWVWS